jgi:hypothetical protein
VHYLKDLYLSQVTKPMTSESEITRQMRTAASFHLLAEKRCFLRKQKWKDPDTWTAAQSTSSLPNGELNAQARVVDGVAQTLQS